MPAGVHQREVGEGDIGPHSLYFLGKPERERVVVARCDQDAVRLDRFQQVHREVVGQRLMGPARGKAVAQERHQCEKQHRSRRQPAALLGAPVTQPVHNGSHCDAEADRHKDPEERERCDEEIVPLAHLAIELGARIDRVAVAEVEVVHQQQREREQQRRRREAIAQP